MDAEDHNIAIYYPTSAGGGCKKLFRKIGNRSSEFYPEINEVCCVGCFFFVVFVVLLGTDVKMYTVGPEYGRAEARKSPTVDGIVERNETGKEVRGVWQCTTGLRYRIDSRASRSLPHRFGFLSFLHSERKKLLVE